MFRTKKPISSRWIENEAFNKGDESAMAAEGFHAGRLANRPALDKSLKMY